MEVSRGKCCNQCVYKVVFQSHSPWMEGEVKASHDGDKGKRCANSQRGEGGS